MGPKITLFEPEDGMVVGDQVRITGIAQNITDIHLNDMPITTDKQGRFYVSIVIPHGYSIITLTAHDRFKRETRITRQLVRK